ncbi:MAG: type IX secretion system sortase PorU [Chitinophagaceae bacterium]|nr:type IX secretion system sortase PorU [Chitinophagaceae bacterium]
MLKTAAFLFAYLCLIVSEKIEAQRQYAASSVLASGRWYKISVQKPGIYKIDVGFLRSMGISGAVSSSSIRLFGNGGFMLPEANSVPRPDDLTENAILVADGGDGILNGNDYFLFFAHGPDRWFYDSSAGTFRFRKNLYETKSYYFITLGGSGKRINQLPLQSGPAVTVQEFSERFCHELDSVNFLSSGKEWYGEELSNLPGRSPSRTFSFSFGNVDGSSPLQLRLTAAGRSVNQPGHIDVSVNNQPAGRLTYPATGPGPYDFFAREVTGFFSHPNPQSTQIIRLTHTSGGINAQAWINRIELFFRRRLSMSGTNQLLFRDVNTVGNIRAEFRIADALPEIEVWNVTNPVEPVRVTGTYQQREFRFVANAEQLREYVAFHPQQFLTPVFEGTVANQNLHGLPPADYIIITHPLFRQLAERLAEFHRQKSLLRVVVVSTEQVYNEFGSGSADPAAIRDFVKMFWDKYQGNNRPEFLLLFGDASFDYKNRISGNTHLVPCWQSKESLSPLATFVSDDFFALLDDHEDLESANPAHDLDIGIGRIPVRNAEEAARFVDKIISYHSSKAFGNWRMQKAIIADDEDANLHVQDAELISQYIDANFSLLNLNKIYLDAFPQQIGQSGTRYPAAVQAIQNQVLKGALFMNYIGHGGPYRLAEETVLEKKQIEAWKNGDRLPVFITATCDFAPFDNPSVASLGEFLLLASGKGAIALVTTTRLVFASSNRNMNYHFMRLATAKDASGNYKALGASLRETKNFVIQNTGDIENARKFTLLGDPGLIPAFPKHEIKVTAINGRNTSLEDTLSASEFVRIEGEIRDSRGQLMNQFNGRASTVIYEKEQTLSTLGNDPGSQPMHYPARQVVVFQGKAAVQNGKFFIEFKIPKDIDYRYGKGKISVYASNEETDAGGSFGDFLIGGTTADSSGDKEGPIVRLYLNDEKFINGGITNETPVFVATLEDSSGINTTGIGIGHDILLTLDNDNNKTFVLNSFYESDLNNFRKGMIRYQLPPLEPGEHSLKLKVWDALNNSSEAELHFIVQKEEQLQIRRVLNYPNPFTTSTCFWFEHNQPSILMQATIEVMTITGKIVKTLKKAFVAVGNRSDDIQWDGRDEWGNRIGRGVYLYRLKVSTETGKSKEVIEKLVIF